MCLNDQERVRWLQGCDVTYINLVPRASQAERPCEQGLNFQRLPW